MRRRWMRLVDRVLGCTPEQIARRRDLRNVYGWSGLHSDEIRERRAAKRRSNELPPAWARAEVMDFEPSDQFVMPEAMGIDYVPDEDDKKEKS